MGDRGDIMSSETVTVGVPRKLILSSYHLSFHSFAGVRPTKRVRVRKLSSSRKKRKHRSDLGNDDLLRRPLPPTPSRPRRQHADSLPMETDDVPKLSMEAKYLPDSFQSLPTSPRFAASRLMPAGQKLERPVISRSG